MANVFELEFDVNTQQGQEAFERMTRMQDNYADALRRTVKETLGLQDQDRITQQHINKLQQLIKLERQRAADARNDYRLQIQNNNQLSQAEKRRALQRLQDEENIAKFRASMTDETILQGSATLIRQDQQAAKLGTPINAPGAQLGHFEGAGQQNMASAVAGGFGGTLGNAASIIARGGSAAKFGIAGLAVGTTVGGLKSLLEAGVERDKALQSVLLATNGRYQQATDAIQASKYLVDAETSRQANQIRAEGSIGMTTSADATGTFEMASNGNLYFGRGAFDHINPETAKATNIPGVGYTFEGGDAYIREAGDKFSSWAEGERNEEWYADKFVEEARKYYDSEEGKKELAESGKDRATAIRDKAYEDYRKDVETDADDSVLTEMGKALFNKRHPGATNIDEYTESVASALEAQSQANAEAVRRIEQEERTRINEQLIREGRADIAEVGASKWTQMGMTQTEGLKYIAQAVQAMPNMDPNRMDQEGYHLAMYEKAGFSAGEINSLNGYYDSGQQLTGSQIFSMLRRELTTSGEDWTAVRKYMESFQSILPNIIQNQSTFTGHETQDLIGTLRDVEASFAEFGTTSFSGKMLGSTLENINSTYQDKGNDWKEVVKYQAAEQAWNYSLQNPQSNESIFKQYKTDEKGNFILDERGDRVINENYNVAAAEYLRMKQESGQGSGFDFQANKVLQQNGIFNNDLVQKNVATLLSSQFGNDPASLVQAVSSFYTGEKAGDAVLLASKLAKGEIGVLTGGTVKDTSYEDMDVAGTTSASQQLQATWKDGLADIGNILNTVIGPALEKITDLLSKP